MWLVTSNQPPLGTARCTKTRSSAMRGWITPEEARRLDPEFFSRRQGQEWTHDAQKEGYYAPFGFSEYRIQVNAEGMPTFGRVCGGEAPNINAVAYFRKKDTWFVSVTYQVRPFADVAYGQPAEEPIVFAQPIMGFREQIVGKTAAQVFESAEQGATREALEEAGVTHIRSIKSIGQHWGNPTGPLVTPTDLLDIEIVPNDNDFQPFFPSGDTAWGEFPIQGYRVNVTDTEERILKCEYIPMETLFNRIQAGVHQDVNYRASVAMNTFFVWLSHHQDAMQSYYNRLAPRR